MNKEETINALWRKMLELNIPVFAMFYISNYLREVLKENSNENSV